MNTAQDRLNQILPSWYDLLTQWSLDGSLVAAATDALVLESSNAKQDAKGQLQSYVSQWSAGNFNSLPQIVLLSAEDISGARGAYADSTDTIYLNQEWLLTATDKEIKKVLTEELGHYLDDGLNEGDTQGDEGQIFSTWAGEKGQHASELLIPSQEDDRLQITVNGNIVTAEASTSIYKKSFGTNLDDAAKNTYALPDGSLLVIGSFQGSMTLGSETLVSNGSDDIFLTCINPNGTYKWSRSFGGSLSDGEEWRNSTGDISVNPDGTIYVTGTLSGTTGEIIELQPGISVRAYGNADPYVAKLDENGNFLWARNGGNFQYDAANSVVSLSDGSAIYVGCFDDIATFGQFRFSDTLGSRDIFIARVDSNGTYLWARPVNNNYDYGYYKPDNAFDAAALSDDSVVITGHINGAAIFDSTTLIANGYGVYAGTPDSYVARISRDGTFIWAKRIGGTGIDFGRATVSLSDDSTVVAGYYDGQIVTDITLDTAGGYDAYVTKVSSAGSFLWTIGFGGLGNDEIYRAASLSDDSVVVVGKFSQTITAPGGTVVSNGGDDLFAARISASGQMLWIRSAGSAGDDSANSVSIANDGTIVIAGSYSGAFGIPAALDSTQGGKDAFVLSIDPNGNWLSPSVDTSDAIFRINGSGTGQEVQTLTCTLSQIDLDGMTKLPPSKTGDPTTGYSYQWQVSSDGLNWTNATGTAATTFKYSVNTTSDANKFLRVQVGYTDDKGFSETVYTEQVKIISGTTKSDKFAGTAGVEVTFSGSGADAVATGAGNDFAKGGIGNDTFTGADGDGDDFFDGQTEIDIINYSASSKGVDIDFVTGLATERTIGGIGKDSFAGIENARGTTGADSFKGSTGVNVFTGSGGADTFNFANAQAFGASTSDRITDMSSDDKIQVSASAFSIVGKPYSFAAVSGTKAVNASAALIVYDTGSGYVYLNKDGATSGLGGGGIFAVLDNKFAGLTAANVGLI